MVILLSLTGHHRPSYGLKQTVFNDEERSLTMSHDGLINSYGTRTILFSVWFKKKLYNYLLFILKYNTGRWILLLEPYKLQTAFFCSRLKMVNPLIFRNKLSSKDHRWSSATFKKRRRTVRSQGKYSMAGIVLSVIFNDIFTSYHILNVFL